MWRLSQLLVVALLQFHGIKGRTVIDREDAVDDGLIQKRLVSSTYYQVRNPAFSSITRHRLLQCQDPNPFLKMKVETTGPLANVQTVLVTVSGILKPDDKDWIGVFSAASHNYSDCVANKALYLATGDTSDMPLLCDYPIKFKFVKDDPGYLSCKNQTCENKSCSVKTCSASVPFRLINIRTSITFVFFANGLALPCILKISQPLPFAKPSAPLYGHLSVPDSSATSLKLTWVSGDNATQFVKYAAGKVATSSVTTFTKDDMCGGLLSAAKDFGWHDPGFIHTATMVGLTPATTYSYQYGSDKVGWSGSKNFTTPPAAGFDQLRFIVYGDMGKAERDNSLEHYVQPGSLRVIDALSKESADAIFHIGDISYATGFIAEWDSFLEMIEPVASRIAYMTAIGNHERNFPSSASYYKTPDSGGECGIPYEKYFQMPVRATDKPWYSIELGPVHFTIMSTEHNWTAGSEQYEWLKQDLSSVNRSRTPWLIFAGHRPMYTNEQSDGLSRLIPGVDTKFPPAVEPLLQTNKVDLALWGHVHNYERTCALYKGNCSQLPTRDAQGVDTYNSTVYGAPIHAVVGMAGFSLDGFVKDVRAWSLVRISDFGYTRMTADKRQLHFEYVATNGSVADQFNIVR